MRADPIPIGFRQNEGQRLAALQIAEATGLVTTSRKSGELEAALPELASLIERTTPEGSVGVVEDLVAYLRSVMGLFASQAVPPSQRTSPIDTAAQVLLVHGGLTSAIGMEFGNTVINAEDPDANTAIGLGNLHIPGDERLAPKRVEIGLLHASPEQRIRHGSLLAMIHHRLGEPEAVIDTVERYLTHQPLGFLFDQEKVGLARLLLTRCHAELRLGRVFSANTTLKALEQLGVSRPRHLAVIRRTYRHVLPSLMEQVFRHAREGPSPGDGQEARPFNGIGEELDELGMEWVEKGLFAGVLSQLPGPTHIYRDQDPTSPRVMYSDSYERIGLEAFQEPGRTLYAFDLSARVSHDRQRSARALAEETHRRLQRHAWWAWLVDRLRAWAPYRLTANSSLTLPQRD